MKKIDKELVSIIAIPVGMAILVAMFAVYCSAAHVKDAAPGLLVLGGVVILTFLGMAVMGLAYWYEGWSIRHSNKRWEKKYYATHPNEQTR